LVPLTTKSKYRPPHREQNKPPAPIEAGGCAIALGELGGVDFDLIVAIKFSFTIGG
jgi:hypothetical protein